MSCAQVAQQYDEHRYYAEGGSFQLESALAAALQREQALVQMVEQQRAEIDHLRSTINAMQLTEALRTMDFSTPTPSVHTTPQHTYASCTPTPSAHATPQHTYATFTPSLQVPPLAFEASLAEGMARLRM